MTVFSKKATIRIEDKTNPTRDIDLWLSTDHFKGIDYIILKNKGFQNQLDVEFVCSNVNPGNERTQSDIDDLLTRLHIVSEKQEHPNDPLKKNNHLFQAITNLDNPNIDDRLVSKAKRVRDEIITKEHLKAVNEDFERRNKRLSETSPRNTDRLKPLDERKTTFKVGEIERG